METTKYTKKANQILEERKSQYGSYEYNIRLINTLKHYIKISVNMDINKAKTILDIEDVNTAVEFTKYILALKAARMKYHDISKEARDDCIIDIINYYNLLVKYLDSSDWVTKYEIQFVHNYPFIVNANKEIQLREEYLEWIMN